MMFIMAQNALIGTEQEFIDQFIEMLTSKSQGKIVCKSADYHMDDSTPSFTLTVHDVFQITFRRDGNKNAACNGYYVQSRVQDSKFISFGNSEYYSRNAQRAWQFSLIGNDNAMLLEFGGELVTMETAPNISFVCVNENGIRYVMSAIGSFSTMPYVYVMDNSYNISQQYSLWARTDIIYDSTQPQEIRITDKKQLYLNNAAIGEILSLKDCMYVPARKNFKTVDGREYFCICQGNYSSTPPRTSTILEVT